MISFKKSLFHKLIPLVGIQLFITELSAQDITLTLTPTCQGEQSGQIMLDVVAEGYNPPFEFEWTDAQGTPIPPVNISSSPMGGISTVDNLAAGSYCVTVTTADGCHASSCDIVVEALPTPVIESIIPICACPSPEGYGSAEVEMSGGSGNYDYTWKLVGEQWIHIITGEDPQFPNWDPLAAFPDTYELTVTDLETGCQATSSVEIDACNGIGLSQFIKVTPDCNEEGTSTISVQLPPGTAVGGFEFRWTKPGVGLVEFDPSEDGFASLENAAPGEYCLNLITMNGCDETVCGIIVESMPAPILTYDVSSNGGNSWTLSTIVTGGVRLLHLSVGR